ncbi:hypothetical protein B0H13DRAFT_2479151 [Mycena leptocephala]|nr:hypothetical protein B0H13DRAFT_2479151 [Mycena leptocephala]
MSTKKDRALEDISDHKSTASKLRSHLSEIEGQIAVLESQIALFPLRLASVCGLWRTVALSTCRLWTHFNPFNRYTCAPDYGRDDRPHLADLLLCWLPRAGSLALNICIKLPTSPPPESDRILQILGQYSSQWRALDLASNGPICFPVGVQGPFPYLTKIALWTHSSFYGPTTVPVFRNAPHLREVRLDAIALVDWVTSVPWDQLTNLDLVFHDLLECLEILTHTPNLEVLVFTTDEELEDPVTILPRVLHRLHTLDLGADGSNELLPHLTLPALEHLHLTSVNSECVEAMEELVTRSRCSPTTLRVSFYEPESIEAMHDCISRVPSVRNLEMLCAGVTGADFSRIFDSMSKDHSILPALTFFTIGECTAQIELRSLVQMLAARRACIEGMAQLKSFKLSFHQEYQDDYAEVDMKKQNTDVELALQQLGDLRSQGLQVSIQLTIKWLSGNITSQITFVPSRLYVPALPSNLPLWILSLLHSSPALIPASAFRTKNYMEHALPNVNCEHPPLRMTLVARPRDDECEEHVPHRHPESLNQLRARSFGSFSWLLLFRKCDISLQPCVPFTRCADEAGVECEARGGEDDQRKCDCSEEECPAREDAEVDGGRAEQVRAVLCGRVVGEGRASEELEEREVEELGSEGKVFNRGVGGDLEAWDGSWGRLLQRTQLREDRSKNYQV